MNDQAAVLQTEGLQEWRPIATAPRDGTYIIVANARNFLELFACKYVAGNRWPRSCWRTVNDVSWSHSGEPTHWIPLPVNPSVF
jgi:hypothetical protein